MLHANHVFLKGNRAFLKENSFRRVQWPLISQKLVLAGLQETWKLQTNRSELMPHSAACMYTRTDETLPGPGLAASVHSLEVHDHEGHQAEHIWLEAPVPHLSK